MGWYNFWSTCNTCRYQGGVAFDGKGLYYGVFTSSAFSAIGAGVGSYYVVKIESTGIVSELAIASCDTNSGVIV